MGDLTQGRCLLLFDVDNRVSDVDNRSGPAGESSKASPNRTGLCWSYLSTAAETPDLNLPGTLFHAPGTTVMFFNGRVVVARL